MNNIRNLIIVVSVMIAAQAVVSNDDVVGVVGMSPVELTSCVAVFVPLGDGDALAGVEWYNNDGTVGFPEIAVSGGTVSDPGAYSAGAIVGYDLYGQSSAWSQVQWSGTYRSEVGGVYVIFRLPAASVFVSEGAGGGAAVGVQARDDGLPGWFSADGEEWIGLHSDCGFAFRPIVVEEGQETIILARAVKAIEHVVSDDGEEGEAVVLRTAMEAPYPNPFNPVTRLKFTLAVASRVELDIYNIRGRHVRRLAGQVFSAGEHVVVWRGKNDRDREVSSGLYIARLRAGSFVQSHRLMMVR